MAPLVHNRAFPLAFVNQIAINDTISGTLLGIGKYLPIKTSIISLKQVNKTKTFPLSLSIVTRAPVQNISLTIIFQTVNAVYHIEANGSQVYLKRSRSGAELPTQFPILLFSNKDCTYIHNKILKSTEVAYCCQLIQI